MFSTMPLNEAWCACCERKGVHISPIAGICKKCWNKGPETIQEYWEPLAYKKRLLDPDPCPFPPGTPEKLEWMADRASAGFQIFNKELDATSDGAMPGRVQPRERPEVFALPKLRIRGVERDGKHWRARPFWLHRKEVLGSFDTKHEAEAVVWQFWVRTLGIFAMLGGKMGNYFRPEIVRDPENADKYPDVPVLSPKPPGSVEADMAMKRDRRKILRPGKKKASPGKVKPTPRPKYDKPLKGPEKIDKEEKPAYPRLYRVAG